MYAFDSRSDCVCLDEPLYRRWLLVHGHRFDRPYKNELFEDKREMKSLNDRIDDAIDELDESGAAVLFMKHMAKHKDLYEFEHNRELGSTVYCKDSQSVVISHRHVLLVRDPTDVVASWSAACANHSGSGEETNLEEVGVVQMLAIYSSISSFPGHMKPIVLDSDLLVSDPANTLACLCQELDIPYKVGEMMHWKAGPKLCDGMWAKYWYQNVHKTTGWHQESFRGDCSDANSTVKNYRTIHRSLIDILRASLPAYEYLIKLSCITKNKEFKHSLTKIYEDERNADIMCWIGKPSNGRLVPRDLARISPFDSAVQGGDAVWEGLRVYRGRILSLDRHLRRLFKSAKAMGFQNTHTYMEVVEAIFQTLAANGMRDGAHMRLTLTRGGEFPISNEHIFDNDN